MRYQLRYIRITTKFHREPVVHQLHAVLQH